MAKIPTILEAGRADGKLIKTNNIYDDNQKKFLSDKLEEIDNNHNTLNNTVNSLTNIVNNNKLDIDTKLQEEITRATNVELALDAELETEKNRAIETENHLIETINNITKVNENATFANIVTIDPLPNSTASNVQQALDPLYKNALYSGIATPDTNPGVPNCSVFYIVTTEGTYSNFNNIKVIKGESAILIWNNGTWTKSSFKPMTDFNSVFDTNEKLSLSDKLTKLYLNISELEQNIDGKYIVVPQTKSGGYYSLTTGLYNNDNSHIFVDVSHAKGKHLTAVGGTIKQYAFVDTYEIGVSMHIVGTGIIGVLPNSIVVPVNANFLYLYLGAYSTSVIPTISIDEGEEKSIDDKIEDGIDEVKAIADNNHNASITSNRAMIIPAHGYLNVSDKQFMFTNFDREKYNHVIIPVTPNDSVVIKKGDSVITGAYLKDYNYPMPKNYNADGKAYVNIDFLSDITPIIRSSDDYIGVVPSDSRYILLNINNNSVSNPYLPKEIVVNGVNVELSIVVHNKFENIHKSMTQIKVSTIFTDASLLEHIREIYIEGNDVDLSQVNRIRLNIGYKSGNYYNTFTLFNGETKLVSYSNDYSSLENAKAVVANGFWDIKSFRTNTLGVSRVVIFGDFNSYDDGNHYYDGTFNNSVKNIDCSPIIKNYLYPNVGSKVGIKKLSNTSFNLIKKENGKTITYNWHKLHWQSTSNGKTVIDHDCWNNEALAVDGTIYAQTSINFIHMIAGYTMHVGNGHGCTVDKVFKVFADGKPIDLATMQNNEVIECDDIHIIQLSDCYYPDRERTIDNGGDGNKVYAKLDSNDNPIIAVRWSLDYHFTQLNEKYINRLFIVNDSTSFNRCYGAMTCVFPKSNVKHLIFNDRELTANSLEYTGEIWNVTVDNGEDMSMADRSEKLDNATKLTIFGDNFKIDTECLNDLRPTFGRIRPWIGNDVSDRRIKMYSVPINVAEASGGIAADVFNAGDVISCHVTRKVSVY